MQSFDRLPSKPNRLRAIATGAILSILIGVSTWSIGVPRAGEWSGFDVGLNRRLGPIHFSQSDSAVWVANGNLFRFNGIRFVQVDSIRAAWSTLQSSGGDFWIGSAADTLLRLGPGTPADTLVLGLPAAWQVPSGCGDFFEFCSRGSGGITSLAEDATGNLWVAVAGRGLVQLDPLTSSWQVIDLSGVAADPTVTPATIEFSPADSSIWVLLRGACELCTGSFSVNLPSDSRTKLIKLSLAGQILEQFAVTEARDVAIDSTGVAWVVGANGLSSFDHTGVESSPVWQGGDFTLDGDLATSIAIGPFGDLWLTLQDRLISGAGRGVLRIDRTLGQFTRFQQGDGLSSDWSARLFLDRFGMLWVAGYAGKIDRIYRIGLEGHTIKREFRAGSFSEQVRVPRDACGMGIAAVEPWQFRGVPRQGLGGARLRRTARRCIGSPVVARHDSVLDSRDRLQRRATIRCCPD